jgi:outer membrane protein insertion porin family
VRVSVLASPGETRGGIRPVQVILQVDPVEQVQVGEVRFEGAKRTKLAVLRRRVDASSGDLLNPVKIEESRYRLARPGSFRRVEAEYDPSNGGVRDVVFQVQELPPWEASLLMGYGSYEQLRGGIELSQSNLWGRAHRSRMQVIQSFKGSRGDYTYTVPELLGEQLDGSVRLFGLQREEVAFERQEYGGTVTLRRKLPWFGADGRLGYTYQSLQNTDNILSTQAVDEDRTKVASIDIGLNRDRRDNPLRPRRGYRWFGQAELAATTLGGEVDYQRIEIGGSYHSSWGAGRWIHAGLTHGLVLTMGAPDDTSLPINKRFYPGGENDLRGFQDGEAAPRAADGSFIGAKTFLLLNLEVEQALTKSWSAIIFFDALGEAARLADYPFHEKLYSAGLGLRYQTLIGPVRLEYGRNLNPRIDDPAGTLHFSVGFPF